MQEIEVKFRLDSPPPPRWIRGMLTMWGGVPGEPRRFGYRDLYWDTPDGILARKKLALRLRLGHRAVWTLKGDERVMDDRVIRREEEVTVPYREALRFLDTPEARLLPSPIRSLLPPLRRLEVVVELVGEREKCLVERGRERGIFHVEEVWVGTDRGVFLELEGTSQLVRSFSRTFSLFTGLAPERRSKLVWALERTARSYA